MFNLSKNVSIILKVGIIFLITTILIPATVVLAGGGPYAPVNFSSGDGVSGQSIDVVVQVTDPNNYYGEPLVGQDFAFEAHHDLNGAYCTTTQSRSDGSGQIKASCGAQQYGVFKFHVRPVSRPEMGDSTTYNIIFTDAPKQSPTTSSSNPTSSSASTEPVLINIPSSSKAPGPCGSGMHTLEFPQQQSCPRGQWAVGYLRCNNDFVVKLSANSCLAQSGSDWDGISTEICNNPTCSAEGVASIPARSFKLEVVGKKAKPAAASTATTSAQVSSTTYLLVTEEPTKIATSPTTIYTTFSINPKKAYQVYFLPIINPYFDIQQKPTPFQVLSAQDNPWNYLTRRFELKQPKIENSVQLTKSPILLTAENKTLVEQELGSKKISSQDQKVIDANLGRVLMISVDPSSITSTTSAQFVPPLFLDYGSSSVLDMNLPVVTQPGLTQFYINYLTPDPFLPVNKAFTSLAYRLDPAGVLLPTQSYIQASYLSSLAIKLDLGTSTSLLIKRQDLNDKAIATVAGDIKPQPSPTPAIESVPDTITSSSPYMRFAIGGAVVAVGTGIIGGSFLAFQKYRRHQKSNPDAFKEDLPPNLENPY